MSSQNKKAKTTKLNDAQKQILEDYYLNDPNPSPDKKKEFAAQFNVNVRAVQSWFYMKRTSMSSKADGGSDGGGSPLNKSQAFQLDSKNKMVVGKSLFFFNPSALYSVTKKPPAATQQVHDANMNNGRAPRQKNIPSGAPPSPMATPMLQSHIKKQKLYHQHQEHAAHHRHSISGSRPDLSDILDSYSFQIHNAPPEPLASPDIVDFSVAEGSLVSDLTGSPRNRTVGVRRHSMSVAPSKNTQHNSNFNFYFNSPLPVPAAVPRDNVSSVDSGISTGDRAYVSEADIATIDFLGFLADECVPDVSHNESI